MNQQERIRIGELWIGLAQMYGRDINKTAMVLMLNAVNDLDPKKVEQVLNDWAMKSKLGRHPYPVEIRDVICPQVSGKDLARNTSLRIREAVRKHGWCNPNEAREHIGEEGWRFVERFGGWMHICQNLGVEIQETTFLAQARDAIESDINLRAAGIDTNLPAIEQSNSPERLGEIIRHLANTKTLEGRHE